jgi:hypothetical protein
VLIRTVRPAAPARVGPDGPTRPSVASAQWGFHEAEVATDVDRFPDRPSASDSVLWRIESDPVLRSPVLVVGLLDRSPSPEVLEATVDRAAMIMPLARRLEVPPLGLGRPRWRSALESSLAAHVRRVGAPGGEVEAVLVPRSRGSSQPKVPRWSCTTDGTLRRHGTSSIRSAARAGGLSAIQQTSAVRTRYDGCSV